jgi:hypothetical protein
MNWVFLVITLGGPFEGYVSVIPQLGEKQCGDNIEKAEALFEGLPIDMVQCIPTDIPVVWEQEEEKARD